MSLTERIQKNGGRDISAAGAKGGPIGGGVTKERTNRNEGFTVK